MVAIFLDPYNPSRCDIRTRSVCGLCSKVQAIDAEIQRLVRERETIVKAQINHNHDPLIRRLPIELVSRVFAAYVKAYKPPDVLKPRVAPGPKHRGRSRNWFPAPLTLSAVCKRWREIALSTPSLWSTFDLLLHTVSEVDPQQLQLITQWLERSKCLPLDIHITESEVLHVPLSRPEPHVPLVEILKQHASRWRKLELHFSAATDAPQFFATLPSLLALEKLQLRAEIAPAGSFALTLPPIPNLKDFQINFPFKPPITKSFTNLVVCRLYGVDSKGIVDVLRPMTNIKECLLEPIGNRVERITTQGNPITFPNLTDFHLRVTEYSQSNIVSFLFDNLILPSLRRFTYEGFTNPVPVVNFVSLLNRSRCGLEELEIRRMPKNHFSQNLIQFLESIPSIRRLSLLSKPFDYDWLGKFFFPHFQLGSIPGADRRGSPYFAFLPNLEKLVIEVGPSSSKGFSWGSFLVFLESIAATFVVATGEDLTMLSYSCPARTHLEICLTFVITKISTERPTSRAPNIAACMADTHWTRFISLVILEKVEETGEVEEFFSSSRMSPIHEHSLIV